uniref:X8 domain-containing protein n=1 Tax=Kalanchoe fedtschenkoi TaxID=63787 RepID=A0A7N0ULQ7_KALFE
MQQPVEALNLYHPAPDVLHKLSRTGVPVAVALSGLDLVEVSSTVLKAEAWLRAHVLAHYPATRITSIVVGHSVLCNKDQAHNFELVLPSLKNMFWSLKRWGLEKDIRLTVSFSSSCFNPGSDSFREDLAETVIKPVLTFIQATNSTYSIDPFSKVSSLVSSHSESMGKMGFLSLQFINVVAKVEDKTSTKLISVEDSKYVKPYPARPTPLPEISPIHSSIGYSSPAIVPKLPSPPASSSTPPIPHSLAPQVPPFTEPPLSHSPPAFNPHPPQVPPFTVPVTPTYGHAMPPCSPTSPKAPKESSGLWCVAKPNVPAETLQVGLDYACGAGGADCQEIKPYGSCFYPNSAVAHASYAFNSYWQKHKKLGGSCSFGGTAMLINADPSFMDCRFVLN